MIAESDALSYWPVTIVPERQALAHGNSPLRFCHKTQPSWWKKPRFAKKTIFGIIVSRLLLLAVSVENVFKVFVKIQNLN